MVFVASLHSMSSRSKISQKKNKNKTRGLARSSRFNSFGRPIPSSADVTFKYVDRVTIDAGGSGAIGLYQFSCNGMYDPDITGTGHQPLGFDQWMGTSASTGFFNHYTVVSSIIRVTAFSQAADGTGQSVVALGISDDTTVSTDFNAMLENPTYTRATLGSIGSGHDVVHLTKRFDAAKILGLPRESLYARDDLRGAYSSNPSEQSYFSLITTSNNVTVNPANVAFLVEITYHAHLSERRELLSS